MADRALSPEFIAAAEADLVSPLLLITAHFDSGDLHLWNGDGNLVYEGTTYTGVLPIIGVDPIQEKSDVSATGLNISLSGLSDAILEIAENEPYQQRALEIKLALLDEDGAIISDPYQFFGGYMDTMIIEDDGKTITVAVATESELIALERALDSKYTTEEQRKLFEGDTGFDFVPDIQNKKVVWG